VADRFTVAEVVFLTAGFLAVVVTVFLLVEDLTAALECAGVPITAKAVRKQKSR
jgi:hypothetical protein